MDLTDIVTQIMDQLGADFDDPGSTRLQAMAKRAACSANRTACSESAWSWLKDAEGEIPVTATSVWCDLPADCKVNGVLWGWREMDGLPLTETNISREQLGAGGMGIGSAFRVRDFPLRYVVQGSKIIFIPLPCAADTIHIGYVSTGDVLVNWDDEPLIPPQFQDILVWLGLLAMSGADGMTPQLQDTASKFYEKILRNLLFAEAKPSETATTTPEFTGSLNP